VSLKEFIRSFFGVCEEIKRDSWIPNRRCDYDTSTKIYLKETGCFG
jgi:hypothetical protein